MDFEVLKQALQDQSASAQASEAARSAAVSAKQETRATIERMNEQVRLKVASAAAGGDAQSPEPNHTEATA